jgi:alpha-L-rhamnosidase
MVKTIRLNDGWSEYIGGPGYTFNRVEFDSPSDPESAVLQIVSDPHSYAAGYFPDYPAFDPDCWLLAGSQIKYRVFVNGSLVGLGPHRPVYDETPCLQSFELSDYLISGRNVLGIICLGEKRGFASRLQITGMDGKSLIVKSGPTWKTLSASDYYRPVCWERIGIDNYWKGFPGPGELPEHLDGRVFPTGWCESGFDDSQWPVSVSFGPAVGDYEIPDMPNLALRRVHPEKIVKLGDGWYFFDFGREVVASLLLAMSPRDSHVEVRLGEECASTNRVRFTMRTANCYQELWKPGNVRLSMEHFGLRAFRYGEVLGWNGELSSEDVSAIVVHYPFDDNASSFESSSKVLNDVWEFCRYSVKATNMDIYQDCPSRERQAYEGDSFVNMLCHYASDNDWKLARRTAQYLLRHPTWPAEWTMLLIPIFWADYMQTGDASLLREHYAELRDKFSFHSLMEDGLVREFPRRALVDWPETQRDGHVFGSFNSVPNAYVYLDVDLLSRIAGVLELNDDSDELRRIAETIRSAYNRRLYDAESGLYVDYEGCKHSSLHSNLFPLAFGLVDDEGVADRCIRFLKERGMACSVFTAHFLLDTLYKYGEDKYALKLLTAVEGNSWGRMLYALGATITTEAWDPEEKPNMSWAHPWAASPVEIVQRRLFGIRPIEPGWRKFSVDPKPGDLEWARIVVPTPRGRITSSFERRDDGLSLKFTVPDGLTALVGEQEYSEDTQLLL